MNGRRKHLLAMTFISLLAISGCCHKQQQCCYPPPGAPGSARIQYNQVPPAQAVPIAPIGVTPTPYAPAPVNPTPFPPGATSIPGAAPGLGFAAPQPNGSAAQPGQATEQPREAVQLKPPQPQVAIKPNVSEQPEAVVLPPVDIPGFALAKSQVASGQKPFPEGIAWLQTRGYRTALYLRRPGEDDRAIQRQFERYNMRYLSLEVAPGMLTREVVEAFNRQVTDGSNVPLYVFDNDGSLTGGMWLLHFRLFEGVSEEKARLEAARVGFKAESAEHKDMAEAVTRYLQSQNP